MAILEKEVEVKCGYVTDSYYEELGYSIKKINKNGKYQTPRGTTISVKIEHLPKNSRITVTKICDECGEHTPNIKYGQIISMREIGDGKDRCPKCRGKKASESRKNNIPYENTLENWAKENNKEYLLEEFSDKNERKPSEISYGTSDEYLWNCKKCSSEYPMKVTNRTNDVNCPFCSGRRINNINCLANTFPEIAKLLKDKNIAYNITSKSDKRVVFICPDCGFEQKKKVYNVVNQGLFSCDMCGDNLSYPEKFMICTLKMLNADFKTQITFDWSKRLKHKNPKLSGTKKYDFYIPKYNLIIETHGSQHYIESFQKVGGKSLLEEQMNDEIKQTIAKRNGIENYVIVNCSQSKKEYIKNNIIKSDLSKWFDFSNVDWELCHQYTFNSYVKVVSNLWNEGIKNTLEISKLVKLQRSTVGKYLKQATELGWCNYDPAEERRKNGYKICKQRAKKIVQLTIEGKFIREWESAEMAGRESHFPSSSISAVCRGERYIANKFRWMLKSDYEKQFVLIQNN